MSEIEALNNRIAQALDRLSRGIEAWDPEAGAESQASQSEAEITSLREALEDERLANAQLQERLRALSDRAEGGTAELREELATQREGLAALDTELQRLRAANKALQHSNDALREANAKGVSEPHLINSAMLAELEGVRAARAADAAETRAVIDALAPLLSQARDGEARS